jgi:hypothetical protein
MSDTDSDRRYETSHAGRVRWALRLQIEELEKELESERERANNAEKKFHRLMKAIYDVLFNSDAYYYTKILRFFGGETD